MELQAGLEMVIVTTTTIMRGVIGMETIVVMVVLMSSVLFANVLIRIINLKTKQQSQIILYYSVSRSINRNFCPLTQDCPTAFYFFA